MLLHLHTKQNLVGNTHLKLLSKKTMVLTLVLSITTGLLYLYNPTVRKLCCSAEYQTFTSPNGHCFIKLYRIQIFSSLMPGNAGDAPGFVRLYTKNNKILQQQDVEMVQLVETIEWNKNSVYIKFVADWTLAN